MQNHRKWKVLVALCCLASNPAELHLGREQMSREDKVQLVKMVEKCSKTGLVLCDLLLMSGKQGWCIMLWSLQMEKRPDKYWVLFLSQTSVCKSVSRRSFRRIYPSCQHLQIPLQFIWGLFGNLGLFPLSVYICCLQSLARQVIAAVCPYFSGTALLPPCREQKDLVVHPTSCNFRLQLSS